MLFNIRIFYSPYICNMITLPLFISGTEITFILFILLMVFGADKIPEIARFVGKTMKSFRHATDEIKYEITKYTDENDLNFDIKKEFEEGKKELNQEKESLKKQADKVKDDIEEVTGPIKRRF